MLEKARGMLDDARRLPLPRITATTFDNLVALTAESKVDELVDAWQLIMPERELIAKSAKVIDFGRHSDERYGKEYISDVYIGNIDGVRGACLEKFPNSMDDGLGFELTIGDNIANAQNFNGLKFNYEFWDGDRGEGKMIHKDTLSPIDVYVYVKGKRLAWGTSNYMGEGEQTGLHEICVSWGCGEVASEEILPSWNGMITVEWF